MVLEVEDVHWLSPQNSVGNNRGQCYQISLYTDTDTDKCHVTSLSAKTSNGCTIKPILQLLVLQLLLMTHMDDIGDQGPCIAAHVPFQVPP